MKTRTVLLLTAFFTLCFFLASPGWCDFYLAPKLERELKSQPAAWWNLPPSVSSPTYKGGHGLLIGIDKYEDHMIGSLRGCVQDANELGVLLKEKYKFQDVLVLENPKLESIRSGLRDLLADAKKRPDLQFVLFYAGQADEDALVPADAKKGQDKESRQQIIGRLEFLHSINDIAKATPNLVVILDTSFAAGLMKRDSKEGSEENLLLESILSKTVVICACLPKEQAYERSSPTPSGAFSFHLTQLLKADTTSLTYRHLGDLLFLNVSAEFPKQHPQVLGKTEHIVLGSFNDQFIPITKDADGKIILKAGINAGVENGMLIGLYELPAQKLITTGIVEGATATDSQLDLDEQKEWSVLSKAGARIISPGFRLADSKVFFDIRPEDASRFGLAKGVLENIREDLDVRPLIRVVDKGSDSDLWELAVRLDSLSNIPRTSSGKAVKELSNDPYFFVTGRDKKSALYDMVVPVSPQAGEKIGEIILSKLRSDRLRSLVNVASDLETKLDIKIIRGKVNRNVDGEVQYESEQPAEIWQGIPSFADWERIRLQLTNQSSEKLYLNLIAIGAQGTIVLLRDDPSSSNWSLPPGVTLKTPWMDISSPFGLETFKVIATKVPLDLTFLEDSRGARAKGTAENQSPIADILDCAVNGRKTRSSHRRILSPDDWAAFNMNYQSYAARSEEAGNSDRLVDSR